MWQLSFLHSGLLWLGAAAVAPLIIHLLWRQKPQIVRFTAVRFIQIGRRRSFRRTRLKHLLLLLLRMGLIALFAMIIARPVLHRGAVAAGEGGVAGTPAAVIVLDDSMSMNYRVGDATWFDTARNRAVELAQSLPETAAAAVLTTSRPGGNLMRERDALLSRIQGLRPRLGSDPCWGALEKAASLLAQKGASRRDIYLFTDMTPSAWVGYEHRQLDLGNDVNLFVVDCTADGASNGAITEMTPGGQPAIVGAVMQLDARVLASGAAQTRNVQLAVDGKTADRRQVTVPANGEQAVQFRIPLTASGPHWAQVSFLDPDALPADDARTLTLDVAPDVSVLCVEDDPKSKADSPSYFVRLALNPLGEDKEGMFRVRRCSPQELEQLPLGPFDVVVLAGADHMGPAAWRRLAAYVAGGGGLLAFAGPGTDAAYRSPEALVVLPAEPGAVTVAPAREPFALRTVAVQHPFMEAMAESQADLGQPRFRQCRKLTPLADADELLSFGPGLPALVVQERGGRAAVFASTADQQWGDFATTPAFLPFCDEMMMYLARRSAGGAKSYPVGAQVPITYEPSRWPTSVLVTAPGSDTPERLLEGATEGQLTYWKTEQPGYYLVDFERQDKKWSSGFAVNTAPVESQVGKVAWAGVQAAIHAGNVKLVEGAKWGEDGIGGGSGSREITPYLALLALALLVAECWLANRFYGTTSESPPVRHSSESEGGSSSSASSSSDPLRPV
jgi:hypothetical protein